MTAYRDAFGNWCTQDCRTSRPAAPLGQLVAEGHGPARPDRRGGVPACGGSTSRGDAGIPAGKPLLRNRPADRHCVGLVRHVADGRRPHPGHLRLRPPAHRFSYQDARPTRTAWEAFQEAQGVCRDYAHLAIAFCRCMNIPARYCTGYLGDIGIPPPYGPMDFAAWFEAYIGGRWHTFDARNNVPRIGRMLIARGRDATDVAISNTFGANTLAGFTVWTDEVGTPVEAGWIRQLVLDPLRSLTLRDRTIGPVVPSAPCGHWPSRVSSSRCWWLHGSLHSRSRPVNLPPVPGALRLSPPLRPPLGQTAYGASCAQCHGAESERWCVGSCRSKACRSSRNTEAETVDRLFSVTSNTMPTTAPGSLASTVYAQIVAYILQQNAIVAGARGTAVRSRPPGGDDHPAGRLQLHGVLAVHGARAKGRGVPTRSTDSRPSPTACWPTPRRRSGSPGAARGTRTDSAR